MSTIPKLGQEAIAHARRGDFRTALELAKKAMASQPRDHGLTLFVGMLHVRQMQLEEAAENFREALRLLPDDPVARLELVRVLVGLDQLDEAERLLGSKLLKGSEPRRLKALITMRRGDFGRAAAMFREIVAGEPRDFESWGNLGVCLLRSGSPGSSVEALTNSLRLRRERQQIRDAWVEAHMQAGTGEQALEIVRKSAAVKRPNDPFIRVTVARLEDMLGRPENALAALEDALRLDPAHAPALIALARLHERQNRLDECAEIIARLEALPEPIADVVLLKAQLEFRRGNLEQALQLARDAQDSLDPGSRAQLIGRIHDRLGNPQEAFRAFEEMNRDNGLSSAIVEARASAFNKSLDRRRASLTRESVRRWPANSAIANPHSPIFLVGFPRSGTTLLDTLLMGHPRLSVAEEKPMLSLIAREIGGYEQLGRLSEAKLCELRRLYFDETRKHVPDLGNRILVDKQPFAILEAPTIHRLFPNARFIFAQRHPCDVVLSCFITRFEPAYGLASFTTLEGTAHIYGEIMRFWTKCRAVLPMIVHQVRYERLVEEAEAEMRALLTFLGLQWDEGVLDHSSTAAKRRFINTPSYAQVVEPLYDHSIGRWERYREQMQPVLPLLEPWAAAMGYEI